MKQNVIIIILSVLLVALIAVAAVTYSALSEDYVPSDVLPAETSGNSAAVTEEVKTAPDFTMTDADGSELALSDFLGKPIVINFWATWCSPCKSELPTFDAAYATYGEDVQFIMLNLTDGYRDTVDGVKKFVADGGYTFPVYFDTALDGANTYGAYSIPMTVFIDKSGAVTYQKIGVISESLLTSKIEALLAK